VARGEVAFLNGGILEDVVLEGEEFGKISYRPIGVQRLDHVEQCGVVGSKCGHFWSPYLVLGNIFCSGGTGDDPVVPVTIPASDMAAPILAKYRTISG
jgi:hypothetical protein